MDTVKIRPATQADSVAVSKVVVRALREANAEDYEPEIIEAVVTNFSPESIATRMRDRVVLVAVVREEIIGTASLDGAAVRSVFVRPDWHNNGIGAALMRKIEEQAVARGIENLTVPSSVTAEGFYQRLGWVFVRDEFHDRERTIIMTKELGSEN